MSKVVPVDSYVSFQGLVEIVIALIFLSWFLKKSIVKWAALASTLEFAGILTLGFLPYDAGNFIITFRDMGLLGASLALTGILFKENSLHLKREG
jgi:hypothetical protein